MKTTIGIPIYNEVKFLERSLKSVIDQADEIIICDNASTDGSKEICEKYQTEYSNIKYIRFKKNRGAAASFRECLNLAKTEYFMWLGGHDLLVKNYVSKLASALDTHPDCVLAYTNSLHLDEQYHYKDFYYYDWHSYLTDPSPEVRVAAIVNFLSDCTMFHGLYRRAVLDEYFSYLHKKATILNLYVDHVILCYMAMLGKILLVHNCNYIRLDPREEQAATEFWKRAILAMNPELPADPNIFPMLVYKGQKIILEELKKYPGCNLKIVDQAIATLNNWKNQIS